MMLRPSLDRQMGRGSDLGLGIRHVFEGSARIAAGRIRVSCQFAEARTGRHVWAERYDRELGDVLALQEEIAGRVAAATEPHLRGGEGAQAPAGSSIGTGPGDLLIRAA